MSDFPPFITDNLKIKNTQSLFTEEIKVAKISETRKQVKNTGLLTKPYKEHRRNFFFRALKRNFLNLKVVSLHRFLQMDMIVWMYL